jgi:hypothetical protein
LINSSKLSNQRALLEEGLLLAFFSHIDAYGLASQRLVSFWLTTELQ